MLEEFEECLIKTYLNNLLYGGHLTKKAFLAACGWLEDYLDIIYTGEQSRDLYKMISQIQSAASEHKEIRSSQAKLLSKLKVILEDSSLSEIKPDLVEKNLDMLSSELNLSNVDQAIFKAAAHCQLNQYIEELADKLSDEGIGPQHILMLLIGLDRETLTERLRNNNPLIRSGLVKLRKRAILETSQYVLPETIHCGLQGANNGFEDVREKILGKPLTADLLWKDFDHIGESRDQLALFLRESIKRKLTGINILLYGPPGTGKTEFSKALANHIGCTLFGIGEKDDNGEEPTRSERIASLTLAQGLLSYQDKSILMFDEMDDLFETASIARIFGIKAKAPSKIFINQLFENNPVPVLWTINDVESLDETIVRRMSLALEILSPPKKTRRTVWSRLISKHQLSLPEDKVDELVAKSIFGFGTLITK